MVAHSLIFEQVYSYSDQLLVVPFIDHRWTVNIILACHECAFPFILFYFFHIFLLVVFTL